jgi:hypothetical protein
MRLCGEDIFCERNPPRTPPKKTSLYKYKKKKPCAIISLFMEMAPKVQGSRTPPPPVAEMGGVEEAGETSSANGVSNAPIEPDG